MALSYYPNWAAFQQFDSEPTITDQFILPQTESTNQLQAFPDYQLFEPDDLFYSFENPNSNSNSLLHDFSNGFLSGNNNTMIEQFDYPKLQKTCHYEQQIYSDDQFFIDKPAFSDGLVSNGYLSDYNNAMIEPFNYPKLQISCDNELQVYSGDQFINNKPAFSNGLVQNPNNCPTFQDYYYSPSETLLPDFPTGPPSYNNGACESVVKKETTGGSLSAQSIAARQRRRKITEKTHELGKLVPGGHKMNTAEMLQAAYKYIKFLQAQVGILQYIRSYHQENGEALEIDEDMQVLLESPLVQEKLYSTEKCLVPKKFVQEISSDHQMVKSNPQLLSIVKQEDSF